MTRVKLIEPQDMSDPEISAICAWVTEKEGAVPNHFKVELNFPEYFKAKLGSTRVLWETGELSLAEIQHIGILVSRANGCPYCTAAFCTILQFGMGSAEDYVREVAENGLDAIGEERLQTILAFALKVNADARAISDADIDALRALGLGDKGIVQLEQ